MIRVNAYLISFVIFFFPSCEKLVEVDQPRSQLISETIFENESTATAATLNLYTSIGSGGYASTNYLCGLSADELIPEQTAAMLQFYENNISSNNGNIESQWGGWYNRIAKANAIIEGLNKSNQLNQALKSQLLGEAIFYRAFCHFYLVNLFGDIPYISSTDYRINGLVFRQTVAEVYELIIKDLQEARTLLIDDYSYSKNERVRVNRWIASALLARVYLYTENWNQAEELATLVINASSLFRLIPAVDIEKVFLKNSKETIWQIIPVNQNYTSEGNLFYNNFYPVTYARINELLLNAFESNDKRRITWIGDGSDGMRTWYYPAKYKETQVTATGAEYFSVLRLAEQYLIRAESRAKQEKLVGQNSAATDVNTIRERAGLSPIVVTTKDQLLLAIEQERRVELFLEWGHRWMDLKRTKRDSDILGPIKPGWNDNDKQYPIPFSELQLNPNMKQNNGY